MKILSWILKNIDKALPARRVKIIEGDTPPKNLPFRDIVLAREGNEDWAAGFKCPCGCGKKLEVLLIKEVKPNWSLKIDEYNRPTLHPSVWLKTGCKSHFWMKKGKIIWC